MNRDFENCRRDPSSPVPSTTAPRRRGRVSAVFAALALLGAMASGGAEAKPMVDLLSVFTPPTLAGTYLAGRHAGSARDIAAAATYFQTALAMDPGNPVLIERTFQLLVADGRIKDALPIAERLVTRDKGHALARLVLGVDALKRGQWDRARRQFGETTPRPLSDLTVAILSAWAQAGRRDTGGALKTVDKVTGLDWYSVFKGYHGALIADMGGRKAEASERMSAAYAGDKRALRVVEAQVRFLARQKKPKEALAVVAEFEKTIPDHPVIEALKAEIEAGKMPAPIIASPQAGAAEFLYGLGSAMGRDGGEDIAAFYLQLALWLTPDAELPTIGLAGLQGQLKQYDKAIALLDHIPAGSKLRPLADIQIGRYYAVTQDYEQASKHLKAVIDRTPKDLDAIQALGDVLRADKKFAESADVYTRAVDQIATPTKGDWQLFYYRGIAYERTKQWPKAEADFDEALKLQPDEPHVLNYLGYSWIDMGRNLDKGLALVKKAVELKSDDGYIVDSLGWAYYKLGRFDEAVKELERAILLKPDDPVINDHLGDAYMKVGRELEATFQWRHAIDMKPEPEELPKIQKKLDDQLAAQKVAEREAKIAVAAKAAAKAAADAAAEAAAATASALAAEVSKPGPSDAPKSETPAADPAKAPMTETKPATEAPATAPAAPAAPAADPASPPKAQ
ncbi:tetratricopeptide repeat protein [Pinisolibacter sp.]|mgnify:FL=1|uniref:tetratricopeptide repeat protein n=1 Tax=Pinisolibacter sp. TaxID=2172024 RepID=UPI002FDE2DD8